MNIEDIYNHKFWVKRDWIKNVDEKFVLDAHYILSELEKGKYILPAVFIGLEEYEENEAIRMEWISLNRSKHCVLLFLLDNTYSIYHLELGTKESGEKVFTTINEGLRFLKEHI